MAEGTFLAEDRNSNFPGENKVINLPLKESDQDSAEEFADMLGKKSGSVNSKDELSILFKTHFKTFVSKN
jgi:hypothetical protein